MSMHIKAPANKSEWAAVCLAGSLLLHAIYCFLIGAHSQAFVDLSAAFGTVGLPSLTGSGYHIEVRRDTELADAYDDLNVDLAPSPSPSPSPSSPPSQ